MALPEEFKTYTRQLMGDDLYEQLERGLTEDEVPVSIRLNPFKYKEWLKAEDTSIPCVPRRDAI